MNWIECVVPKLVYALACTCVHLCAHGQQHNCCSIPLFDFNALVYIEPDKNKCMHTLQINKIIWIDIWKCPFPRSEKLLFVCEWSRKRKIIQHKKKIKLYLEFHWPIYGRARDCDLFMGFRFWMLFSSFYGRHFSANLNGGVCAV